jgi:GAF domain-containing protein
LHPDDRPSTVCFAGLLERIDDYDVRRPTGITKQAFCARVRLCRMDPVDDRDVGKLDIAALQELLLRTNTLGDFLHELALRAARDTGHRCGITVRTQPGRPYTVASSDDITLKLDELQYADGEGPCLEALETGVPVFVTDMITEVRWGNYPKHAAEVGARSSVSYPLMNGDTAVGALNLYAFEPSTPSVGMQARAAQFAEHAAGAVALALRIAEHGEMIDNLRTALTSRTVIDQAIGILMAQEKCDATAAFDLLRKASQGRNIKVRDVAAGIVAGVSRGSDGPRPG